MTSNLEARLQYLETREEANTRDNVRLKTENAELQNKMLDLMQENSKAMKKLMEMETAFQQMDSDLKTVFGFRENIDRHLISLESKVTNVKDTEDRVSSLETLVNEMRLEIVNNSQSVSEKLEDLRRQRSTTLCSSDFRPLNISDGQKDVKDQLDKNEKGMSDSQKAVDDQLEIVEASGQESKRVHQSLTDKIKLMEREAQETQNSVGILTKTQDLISLSATRVMLEPRKTLRTGVTTKLDKCTFVYFNNGLFNKASSCLEPSIGGKYLVNVAFCQSNNGCMKVFLKCIQNAGGMDGSSYIGQTAKRNDVCSLMDILHFDKGAKVWVETKQDEGNACIHYCILSAFLISPSPA